MGIVVHVAIKKKGIRSPLAGWLGGKFRLADTIIGKMPHHTCYVEPFAGAAWVFFKKEPSKVEVINDINKELITLYRVLQYHYEEFLRYTSRTLASRDEFERMRNLNPETLTDIQRATRLFYMQQCAFGGKIRSQSFGYSKVQKPKLNASHLELQLMQVHQRLSKAYIECLPYGDIMQRYDSAHTFFYIDPPYWGTEQYYGKGFFCKQDFALLADILGTIKGKFLLSMNDTPEIRSLFGNFDIQPVTTQYSCGKEKGETAREVLIKNY